MRAELIEDFRHGLDTRRFMLNSPAGTLTTLQNAHITPGGEIEKRKAFVPYSLPSNCFGLEVTEDGFLTFGSAAQSFVPSTITSAGNTSTFNVGFGYTVPVGTRISVGSNSQNLAGTQVVTASTTNSVTIGIGCGSGDGVYSETPTVTVLTFPGDSAANPVSYQRLQHPDGATAMTAVLHSTVYNGLAFVVASFGGAVFAFYDGDLIYDFISGKAASWLNSNSGLAAHLSALINRSGSFSSSSLSSVVTVTSPSGLSTEVTVEKSTAAGTLVAATTRTQVDGIVGVSAQGQFSIVAGVASAGANKVASVLVAAQELLAAAVDYVTSNDATAAAVKDAINARQATVMATTFRARTSNVATLTMLAHKFLVGDIVTVATVGGTGYNGTVTLTAVTGTTISYASTGSNEGSTADVAGTVTIGTRVYTAAVDENVVQIIASATGTAPNARMVSVTVAGAMCVDQYSFKLTLQAGTTATIPTVNVYINGASESGGAVAAAATLEAMAEAVALAVRTDGTYTAVAIGNEVFLSRLTTTSSSLPLSVMIILGSAGGVSTSAQDVLVVTPGPLNLTLFGPAPINGAVFTGSTLLSVNVSGGTPPYSYKWAAGEKIATDLYFNNGAATNGHPRVQFLPTDTELSPQLKFTRTGVDQFFKNNFSGNVQVTVTDNAGRFTTAQLFLQVKFYDYT